MRISDWSSDVCSSDLDGREGWLRPFLHPPDDGCALGGEVLAPSYAMVLNSTQGASLRSTTDIARNSSTTISLTVDYWFAPRLIGEFSWHCLADRESSAEVYST